MDAPNAPSSERLTLADSWLLDSESGLWRCGDIYIFAELDDPRRYHVADFTSGDPIFSGEIPPTGLYADDFKHFAGLVQYEGAQVELEIPSTGLEGWWLDVVTAADEAHEQAWLESQKAEADRRTALGIVDIAEVLEYGTTEPEMQTTRLVRGELHYVYGLKESGKTWLVADDIRTVMEAGGTVVWIDKEMGRKNIADRLKTLARVPADPETWTAEDRERWTAWLRLIRERLIYLEHPTLDLSPRSRAFWTDLLQERRPALMVVDAQTEVLADADLSENLSTDIQKWHNAYVTPARLIGCTVVLLDHTGHEEQGRARGSGHKGAAAKVEWGVQCATRFDREREGVIEITLNKNTVSAPLPETVRFRVGGTPFVFEPTDIPVTSESEKFFTLRQEIAKRIHEAGETGLTKSQLEQLVTGRASDIRKAAVSLANDKSTGIVSKPSGNGVRFYWQGVVPDEQSSLPREGNGTDDSADRGTSPDDSDDSRMNPRDPGRDDSGRLGRLSSNGDGSRPAIGTTSEGDE